MESGGKGRDEEQDGMSVHSPCKAPPSSASSLPKASLSLCLCVYIYICKRLNFDCFFEFIMVN
jgi:hypothetical protein